MIKGWLNVNIFAKGLFYFELMHTWQTFLVSVRHNSINLLRHCVRVHRGDISALSQNSK